MLADLAFMGLMSGSPRRVRLGLSNSAIVTNTVGTAAANSGGIHGTLFTPSGSTFDHNRVVSTVPPGSPGNAGADSGAGEISGDITRTRFTGNTPRVPRKGMSSRERAASSSRGL